MPMSRPEAASVARPLDALASIAVVGLALCWGFNQVAIKLALADIPAMVQATIRSLGAAAIIIVWTRLRGLPLTARDATLVPGIIAGTLFGTEFILIYQGLQWTTASRASLFIYTSPFCVALGARWFLPGDRLSWSQWLGLVLSFVGLAIAVGLPPPAAAPWAMVGDLMMLTAGVAWGATTLVIKASALNRARPEKTLLYQLVVSGLLLAIGAFVLGERIERPPSGLALGALTYQILVASFTFLAWFGLMVRYSASRLSAFTFLTPLCGVAAGAVVLGEPITPSFLAAAALVVAGLVLVNRPR
jgi:drug/metabolite transporter (DMT)-like permease